MYGPLFCDQWTFRSVQNAFFFSHDLACTLILKLSLQIFSDFKTTSLLKKPHTPANWFSNIYWDIKSGNVAEKTTPIWPWNLANLNNTVRCGYDLVLSCAFKKCRLVCATGRKKQCQLDSSFARNLITSDQCECKTNKISLINGLMSKFLLLIDITEKEGMQHQQQKLTH